VSGEVQINSCRNCGARINGCVSCGRRVITDDVRVGVSFTPEEAIELIKSTTVERTRDRLLCALGMLDRDLERRTRMELASTEPGCPSCPLLEQRLGIAEEKIDELQGIVDDLENSAWDRSR
jgi:hypothetical protein